MVDNYEYSQISKQIVRHKVLFHAIDTLTRKRGDACCVSRNYVRKVYDFFTQTEDYSNNSQEAKKIEKAYITNWEHLHDACTGKKTVEDLTVCYLCGPEPNNDFQELLDLGVLPQNIWAFEYTSKTYKTALGTYSKGQFPQPRLIKQNIETFFKYTPKKFDVVYIDACGCVPSDQHALRCLTNVCRYSRLSSPGVIITNFSSPDSEKENINEYVELVSTYLFFKKYPNDDLYLENYEIRNEDYYIFKQKVSNNFLKYYGDFISAVIRDIPSVIVPLQRLSDNPYFQQLSPEPDIKQVDFLSMLENTSGNSIGRFFVYCEYIKQAGELPKKIESFIKEVEDKEDTLKKGVMRLQQLRIGNQNEIEELQKIRQFFAGNEAIYQFLDKPHSNLIIDAIINQLVYPMHFCPWKNWRYKY